MSLNLTQLSQHVHQNNKAKGFYDKINAIESKICRETNSDVWHLTQEDFDFVKETFIIKQMGLIDGEIGEAMEAVRKNDAMDDKLPHRKGSHCELADALIRILDLSGYLGIDLQTIVEEKLAFNQTRPYLHGKTC